jgi:hypothetical protein
MKSSSMLTSVVAAPFVRFMKVLHSPSSMPTSVVAAPFLRFTKAPHSPSSCSGAPIPAFLRSFRVGSSAAERGDAIQLTAGRVGAIQPAAGSRREEGEESSGVYLVNTRVVVPLKASERGGLVVSSVNKTGPQKKISPF